MRLTKLSPPKRDELALLRRALRASGYEAPAIEHSKPEAAVSEEAAVATGKEGAGQSELSQREQASQMVEADPLAARAGPLQGALQRARQAEKAAATAASRHQVSGRH